MANTVARARARAGEVVFAAARIDGLVLCDGDVLRTRTPDETHFGVAQVRRVLRRKNLQMVHLVFAPWGDRPIVFSLVRLRNTSDEPLPLQYTETWDVSQGEYVAGEAACERRWITAETFALADVGTALRAQPPEPPPNAGLALDLRMALPPQSDRQLSFAFVAAQGEEDPATLVRAWRGDVPRELARTLARWERELGTAGSNSVEAYRRLIS